MILIYQYANYAMIKLLKYIDLNNQNQILISNKYDFFFQLRYQYSYALS